MFSISVACVHGQILKSRDQEDRAGQYGPCHNKGLGQNNKPGRNIE